MNSDFEYAYAYGDGSLALFDISTMQVTISNTMFLNMYSGYSSYPSFGGVFRVDSIGTLTLDTITVSKVYA